MCSSGSAQALPCGAEIMMYAGHIFTGEMKLDALTVSLIMDLQPVMGKPTYRM